MKRCPGCREEKAREAFARDSSRADGLKVRCRDCDCARYKAYYESNRDAVLARVRARGRPVRKVASLPRLCKDGCGRAALSRRHWYCGPCGLRHARLRNQNKKQASTSERGYDAAHRRLRLEWAPKVDRGEVECARCGEPIDPREPWDLGHDDFDRSVHTGPEHRDCNRRAGALKGNRARAAPPALGGGRLAGW